MQKSKQETVPYLRTVSSGMDEPLDRNRHTVFLELADFEKSKKLGKEKIKRTIKQQLGYVNRDLKRLDVLLKKEYELDKKFAVNLTTIRIVYQQQKYMFKYDITRLRSVSSASVNHMSEQLFAKKTNKLTDLGAKLHLSVDELGLVRIEHLSFDSYNEGLMFIHALEASKYRNGCYPERVLVDQIYRTTVNIAFCKKNNLRIDGSKMGQPTKDKKKRNKEAKIAAQDNVDRIQIECFFSTAKCRNGLGLITKKCEDTSL